MIQDERRDYVDFLSLDDYSAGERPWVSRSLIAESKQSKKLALLNLA